MNLSVSVVNQHFDGIISFKFLKKGKVTGFLKIMKRLACMIISSNTPMFKVKY